MPKRQPPAAADTPAVPDAGATPLLSDAEVDQVFARLAAANPEPRSELQFHNPFTMLVAVVLSAQATDAGVNKATGRLFALADTPQAMLALGEERLRALIKTIGLFNTKAKNVIALSEALLARHGGEVPAEREALQALPGVGRKTASVVLNVAFGQPTIAVDTHVFRVANRIGLVAGRTPEQVEAALLQRVPERWRLHAHHWLILHGRHVCKARAPLCPACVIRALCRYPGKVLPPGQPPDQPQPPGKPARRQRQPRA
jgi:endonuclease-3